MNKPLNIDDLEVGFDIPAAIGMDEADIQTPCLVLDLDALERNIKKMGDYAKAHGMRHRVHGKMHKSVDVAKLQEKIGGAVGVCCQKVSEAEVFARIAEALKPMGLKSVTGDIGLLRAAIEGLETFTLTGGDDEDEKKDEEVLDADSFFNLPDSDDSDDDD